MDAPGDTRDFYENLPRLTAFADLADPGSYAPLPDDWVLGIADIVDSTAAIAQGRYKTVNMVGAAVISAQINGSPGRAFPYVFGGDGASFACPPDQVTAAARALAEVQAWAKREFGLQMRAALVDIAELRSRGREAGVARFQVSPGVDYAMFSGGGSDWAERQMKAGEFGVPAAPEDAIPDLTGLSCRWSNMKSSNGSIVSVVVVPAEAATPVAFAKVAQGVVGIVDTLSRGGHPVPTIGPEANWPPPGLTLDAHVSRGRMSLVKRRLQLLFENLFAWTLFKTGIRIVGFDPVYYRRMVGMNADFRKFDDGLKMTLDCDAETLKRLTRALELAQRKGTIRFGIWQQDEAMMTCIVPSALQDDHVHFVDGADGGYTRAAAQIKAAVQV